MAKQKIKLTNNADEADIASLMGNDSIFTIPFFQRPYKWKPARLTQLNSDLLSLVDEESDVHFLGAIIIHGLASKPADPQIYEVIDGQQRLTTLYIYMCAVVKLLLDADEEDEAANLFRKFLVTSIDTGVRSNLSLHPCKEDQADLNAVIRELLGTKQFSKRLSGFNFIPLPGMVEKHGRVTANFLAAKKFLRSQVSEGGIERVRAIYTCLLQKMSVVQIDVQDPTNGPKIFDSLNSRQEPMTIGDLVRNDVFSRVAIDDPEQATVIDAHLWQPFYELFKSGEKNYFDDYFFPFGLVHDPNLRKSDVYSTLKKQWDGKSPQDVIGELAEYQENFLDLILGGNRAGLPPVVNKRIERLFRSKLPSSTLPFLMKLTQSVETDGLNPDVAAVALDVIDSFLTRRAICGHEPTGLHAVFKRLWQDCQGDLSVARVTKEISSHKTVAWPDDSEVLQNIRSRPSYGTTIAKYVLMEYDQSLGGDKHTVDPWIEHVLPSTYAASWSEFTTENHVKMRDLLANLILLSPNMNISLGNDSYLLKRERYAADSVFKSARNFAAEYSNWTPLELASRTEVLGEWFLSRWPYGSK